MRSPKGSWESELNDLNPECRRSALDQLLDRVRQGEIVFPEPGHAVNLHCHTFFSFNGYGYSPTFFAWKARCEGLRVAGIVDFDVLDAVDEFLEVCPRLGLRGCTGIETRVFVREFATREINSPGEPGIAYHMGVGFTSGNRGNGGQSPISSGRFASWMEENGEIGDSPPNKALLAEFKRTAQERNRSVAMRVNAFLDPVVVDYESDVLPLTPNGNATERHLCIAYDGKAQSLFPDETRRAEFWAGKLGTDRAEVRSVLNDPPAFQALIRSRTMKAGGVGYVKPSGPDFPTLESMNAFVLEAGAIPTFAWLDGTSEGEQAIEELLDVMLKGGVAAVNIIPDRNWNITDPAVKKTKLDHLYRFVDLARSHDLPISAGTEMNAYGQRFVDDFDAPELRPLTPLFLEGAHIFYAHTILQPHAAMGYLSDWAKRSFASVKEKNAFFKHVGEVVDPSRKDLLAGIEPHMTPEDIETAKHQRRR